MTWYDENGNPDRSEPIDPVEALANDLEKAYGKSDGMIGTDGMAKTAIVEMRPDPDAYREEKEEEDEDSKPIEEQGNGDPSEEIVNKTDEGQAGGIHIDINSHKGEGMDGMGYSMAKSATELLEMFVNDMNKGIPVGDPKKPGEERGEHEGGLMGMSLDGEAASAIDTDAPASSASGDELSAKKDDIREDVKGPKTELEDKAPEDEDLQMKKSEEEVLLEEIKKAIEARMPMSMDDAVCKAIETHNGTAVYTEMNHGLVDSPWKKDNK